MDNLNTQNIIDLMNKQGYSLYDSFKEQQKIAIENRKEFYRNLIEFLEIEGDKGKNLYDMINNASDEETQSLIKQLLKVEIKRYGEVRID